MAEIVEIKTSPNIGKRFFAALIDYGIINTINFLLIINLGTPDNEDNFHLEGWPVTILIFVWAFMTIGLEQLFGSTIGNSIVSLKPVPLYKSQTKLSFIQSSKRHLLAPIDMFFFGLIAILTIKNTEKNQRLGDLWAKTVVVHSSAN
jgi:uncharacterized RDD family membrane protein YckC